VLGRAAVLGAMSAAQPMGVSPNRQARSQILREPARYGPGLDANLLKRRHVLKG